MTPAWPRLARARNREVDALADLKSRLRGGLLLRGDAGYDEARSIWNAMIDRSPALIARCLGTADIVACVKFARAHELLLSVKEGGHNIAGLAVCDGGFMLDTSLMRGVWVDPDARTARAQPGCLLGDVGDAAVVLNIAASWESAADDAPNVEWARAAWRDMRRFSTGGTYVNFLTEEEGDERVAPPTGRTIGASSTSRRNGTRRTCSAPTRTSRRGGRGAAISAGPPAPGSRPGTAAGPPVRSRSPRAPERR